jgi:hypothetical protein
MKVVVDGTCWGWCEMTGLDMRDVKILISWDRASCKVEDMGPVEPK